LKSIALASSKGGSGKSTLALHLAALAQLQELDVLIVDMDSHSLTATEWALEREEESPAVVRADPSDVSELLKQAKNEGFDLVILDMPPYISEPVAIVTDAVDLTIVPCRTSFADLRTLTRVLEKVRGTYFVVLNACHPGGLKNKKTVEALDLLKEHSIPVSTCLISQRVAFADALNSGHAVVEYDPESRASSEVSELLNWSLNELQKT
jgi:chromosome partitioning protein